MPLPWLRILAAVIGLRDLAGAVRPPSAPPSSASPLALKEERERLDAERERAERALRAEQRRQAADREIGRLRLLAGLAVGSWLGTLLFSARLVGESPAARAALGIGWLLLLAALAASFVAQSNVAAALARAEERQAVNDPMPSAWAGAIAIWLIVAGLAVIAFAVLFA